MSYRSNRTRLALMGAAAAPALLLACPALAAVAQPADSANSPTVATSDGQQAPASSGGQTTVKELVITAQRKALETAAEMKRTSDTVSDSVVLDEAGKVPSTSLLEILERVPGVTTNRIRAGAEGSPDGFTFEGSGIQVRGLTGTKTLLNGREVFSANGGSGLNFSDIGPELLKAVTVYKASRADLIEGGVAATLDLQTYMPFDFRGTHIAGSISGSYGDFSNSLTPSASVRASTRFDTPIGEFGILGDVAYSKIKSYDSNILVQPYYPTQFNGQKVYAPGGFSATDDQFERTRKGFYGAVQWRPTPNLEFFHTTFISEWNSNRNTELMVAGQPAIAVTSDSQFNDGVFVRGGITNATSPASGIAVGSNASFTPSHSKTADFSQGFKYSSGRWNVSGSYQHVSAQSGSSKYGIGLSAPGVVQTNIDTTNPRPAISFAAPFVADPATTKPSNFAWLTQANHGHADSLQLDASYDVGEGFFKKVAVGARVSDRTETDTFVGTWWSATAHGWNGVPQPSVATSPAGDFRLEQFSNFFKGDLHAPAAVYVPDGSALKGDQFTRVVNTYAACAPDLRFQCSNPAKSTYLYGNPPDPSFGLQPSFSTTKPTTKSAYAMVGFGDDDGPLWRFSGNFGVRWVNYDVESEGNYVFSGNTTYYRNVADAQASLAQIGGLSNLTAWQNAHPGEKLPLSLTSVSSSSERSGRFSKDYFLPSFNIKFEPTDSLILRYALTETMTAPSYGDIRAQGSASVFTTQNPLASGTSAGGLPAIFAGYSFTSGNPSMKPETALNNDISIEWYPNRGTSLHLSLFHKAIKNQFLYNSFSATAGQFFNSADQPMSIPADGGAAQFIDGQIVGKGNINAGKNTIIKGAELGGRTYFDDLPGLLKGFGVDANVTYIDGHSPDALALDMNGAPLSAPLVGLSKWAYSTTLLYDQHKFSGRLSWTWRSRYLVTTWDASTSGTYTPTGSTQAVIFGLPVYAAAAGRLDASLGYQLNDRVSIRFDAENITNTDQRTLMEILPGKYVQRGVFVTDRRYSLNVGFNF